MAQRDHEGDVAINQERDPNMPELVFDGPSDDETDPSMPELNWESAQRTSSTRSDIQEGSSENSDNDTGSEVSVPDKMDENWRHPYDAMIAKAKASKNKQVKYRIVDIFKDAGIWIVLDEGCNSNCRGKLWAENAQEKMDR